MEDVLPNVRGDGGSNVEARPFILIDRAGRTTSVDGRATDALLEGRAYSVGTSLQVIDRNKSLVAVFTNPVGSGKRAIVTGRLFSNNRVGSQSLARSEFIVEPLTLSGGTSVVPNNRLPEDDAPQSAMQFWYDVTNGDIGPSVLSRFLPNGGVFDRISDERIVYPGQAFAYRILGVGGGKAKRLEASIAVTWFEEELT